MLLFALFFFFKQKTAYEMRISDWSSDVCSSDLPPRAVGTREAPDEPGRPTGHTNPHPICRLTRGVQSNPRPVQHFRKSVARCFTGPAATPLKPHEAPPNPTPPHAASPGPAPACRGTFLHK